jgi:hypothetical protein
MTRLFAKLVAASGLPPVTLHGLRHGAATLALAAGADLKVAQDRLGHSTITLTADAYTSVLPETARTAAEHTAASCSRPPASQRRRLETGGSKSQPAKYPLSVTAARKDGSGSCAEGMSSPAASPALG